MKILSIDYDPQHNVFVTMYKPVDGEMLIKVSDLHRGWFIHTVYEGVQ